MLQLCLFFVALIWCCTAQKRVDPILGSGKGEVSFTVAEENQNSYKHYSCKASAYVNITKPLSWMQIMSAHGKQPLLLWLKTL